MADPKKIAAAVLSTAKLLDPRMPKPDPLVLEAWTAVFQGQPVWPKEALDAVAHHYRTSSDRIMPAHVLEYCKAQPVNSSMDHVQSFIDEWLRFPSSTVLSDMSGVPMPDDLWDEPDHTKPIDRAGMRKRYEEWVRAHRDEIAWGILNSNGNRKALNQ